MRLPILTSELRDRLMVDIDDNALSMRFSILYLSELSPYAQSGEGMTTEMLTDALAATLRQFTREERNRLLAMLHKTMNIAEDDFNQATFDRIENILTGLE